MKQLSNKQNNNSKYFFASDIINNKTYFKSEHFII